MVKPRLFYGKTTYGLPMDSYGFYHGFPVKNHGFPMDSYGKTLVFRWTSPQNGPQNGPLGADRVHFREPSTAFGAALEVGFVLLFYNYIYRFFYGI